MNAPIGYWMLVLHAHLPFARHPEYADPFEERWLFEAIIECYLPLLDMLANLERDNVRCRFTMSLTPPLLSMLKDPFLQRRFLKHLDKLIELAEKETNRTRNTPEFYETAFFYLKTYQRHKAMYEDVYKRDIPAGFLKYRDSGQIEIITCGATHGFLPLLGPQRQSVNAQIKIAVQHHQHYLGFKPTGIWLPECAYNPVDETILKKAGICYFFLETHGVTKATPKPRNEAYGPICTPNELLAFGRDRETAEAVWSAYIGYPGDIEYREFYKDIGYELDMDYIKPYIHESGVRINTGIKYYRVTGKVEMDKKAPYSYPKALEKTKQHANDFVSRRIKQLSAASQRLGIQPLVVSPYDAELYGHWWFEGPKFLENVFRALALHPEVMPVTVAEYLETGPKIQVCRPYPSTWGMNGYHEFWLNESNHYIWKHLRQAASRMSELVQRHKRCKLESLIEQALNQALRELLLAQSSDWAFIMTSNTTVDYAKKRTEDHLARFHQLCDQIEQKDVSPRLLLHLENKNNIFPLINFRVFCDDSSEA